MYKKSSKNSQFGNNSRLSEHIIELNTNCHLVTAIERIEL